MRRELDFIVIGTQKGGTTSLWEYLRSHPRIAMPAYKELPVFCVADETALAGRLAELIEKSFDGAGPEARLGKVSTHYMMGLGPVDVENVAGRIAAHLPRVRLIALLRDPIERAASQYRMSVRRGIESRDFDDAVGELLAEDQLAAARERATETNSYLVQGEYGRILGHYRARFPAEQLHVEATAGLDRDPGAVLDRVLSFLDVEPGFRPDDLGERHHRGGTRPRIDAEAEERLRRFMDENVWPALGERAERAKLAFDFFLETWNVIPDDRRPELSEQNRRRLEAHYRADAELLGEIGVEAGWLDGWKGG